MQNRIPLIVGGLALALSLLVSGCSSSTDQKASTSPAQSTLTVGQTSGITQLDPNTTTLSTERILWNLLWDGLTTQTKSGTVKGELATDWKTSDDQLTWTFTLRKGVTFHDGRAFTAADAVKNIERVLDPAIASPQRSKISKISGVTAVDDTTLEVHLASPMPQLPAALVDVKMTDVDSIAKVNDTANGTGPYVLEKFVPDQEVDLTVNPDYFGGAEKTKEIKIVKYSDVTSAESALSSGTIDVLWGLPYDQLDSQLSDSIVAVTPKDPSQTAVFELDNSSAPFNDVRARQALSYATDRKAIQAASYGGQGVINTGSTLVSPLNPYASNDVTKYSYDLDKAKKLFAEAGVSKGDTLTCWATAGSFAEFSTTCQILQQSLAKIGIQLDIQTNENSTWLAKFYPAGKSYPGLIVPDYLSREAAPLPFVADYFGVNGWSPTNWPGTAEYESAKAAIKAATTKSASKAAFAQFQKITSTEQPLVTLVNVGLPSITRSQVHGMWIESNGTTHVESATIAG